MTLGAIRDSNVFAGVASGLPLGELPSDARRLATRASVCLLSAAGSPTRATQLGGNAFIDSNVVAAVIRNIRVTDVDLDSGSDDFGFAATRVNRYRRDTVRFGRTDLTVPGDYDNTAPNTYVLRILGDTPAVQGPTATITANDLTAAGEDTYTFTVEYNDSDGVAFSDIDIADVTVTAPAGVRRCP